MLGFTVESDIPGAGHEPDLDREFPSIFRPGVVALSTAMLQLDIADLSLEGRRTPRKRKPRAAGRKAIAPGRRAEYPLALSNGFGRGGRPRYATDVCPAAVI